MKLNKSTIILFNLILILMIALLLKSLITIPIELYAKGKVEYKITDTPTGVYVEDKRVNLQKSLNKMAEDGWEFVSECTWGIIFKR